MKKKRYSEEQIIGFLKEAGTGIAVRELCRQYGFSETSFYTWRSKFGNLDVPEARRLRELEVENAQLRRLLTESLRDAETLRVVLERKC